MARELQARFDREKTVLDVLDKKVASRTAAASDSNPKECTLLAGSKRGGSSSLSKTKLASADDDLEFARKLQASYDREDSILSTLESRKKQGALSRPAAKKPRTRKISAFFGKASK